MITPMADLLTLEQISRSFGGLMAVSSISLAVREGEILGLIGPNGAGKTTLFNIIAGALPPSSGRITLGGEEITRLGAHQRCRRGIARSFQLVRPFLELTALENVAVARVYGRERTWSRRRAEEQALESLRRVGLADRAALQARHLTLVDRKRLELARALATRPRLLLLDELLAGLNPTEVNEAMALIREIRASGITVVMVEHMVKAIFGVSDRVVVMNAGEQIAAGTPAEVASDQRVIDAYLGVAHAA
jgi:branched-chain amino acid transport system ATP-binding protein